MIEKFLNHFKIIYEINITIKELRENIQIRYNKINNNETINKENDNKKYKNINIRTIKNINFNDNNNSDIKKGNIILKQNKRDEYITDKKKGGEIDEEKKEEKKLEKNFEKRPNNNLGKR